MDLWMVKLITGEKLFKIPITDVVINDIQKWWWRKDLSHKKYITEKRKKLFSLMLI